MSKQTTNPAVTFHADLQALREKYPMVYLEAWTPDDFIERPEPVDWNHHLHEITADNLYHHFDANYGTNWERIRYESVSSK